MATEKAAKPAASSSEKRGPWQLLATFVFVVIVALQLPFFHIITKGEGVQKQLVKVSPVQVVASQLLVIKKRALPEEYVKVVLWPGAAYKQASLTFECQIGWRTKKCKKNPRWLPNWETLISSNDPRKVDEAINNEFKDRKVQLVAASFFAVLGALVAPFCLTRLPIFGCVLYWYPLFLRGIAPTIFLGVATVCGLIVLHFGGLRKKKFEREREWEAANAKPAPKAKPARSSAASSAGDKAAAENAVADEYLANLQKNKLAEQAARVKLAKGKEKAT
mmetsp:Transcript_10179/g.21216  ORF Transcript_10179/g.21216 Transcript_10179/m.21216 type:complete len:277 (-) Transcript_10179:321-1151(-)|eukprot:CAMPEP_0118930228 /NCGR_PEP_ID=MMETSP1169-20130426/6982_1 /TAXON_ID=36882 /ORGANISM="Pyramimonas obovata, Strain CCMP722" /LENGTH=276 /DNA_ID=CAMNT_0006872551 /DNA_START=127 /DNA_END=957 /DNA_ORIENTATION=-